MMKCTSAKATFQQAPRQVRYVSITPDALNKALIGTLKSRTVESLQLYYTFLIDYHVLQPCAAQGSLQCRGSEGFREERLPAGCCLGRIHPDCRSKLICHEFVIDFSA